MYGPDQEHTSFITDWGLYCYIGMPFGLLNAEEPIKEFFKAIKGVQRNFKWTKKCEEAFQSIKEHLSKPPILSNPKVGETLVLYLAVSSFTISVVLVREKDSIQLPVYYVSKRLADAETRYTNLEKLAYALILASRKLRPYFQGHKIEVQTSYPLKQVMHKPDTSGQLLKWEVELSQFEVDYKPQTAIKGQALADFVLEFPPYQESEQGAFVIIPGPEEVEVESQNSAPWWSLYVDGASNGEGAETEIQLISPEAHKIRRATHLAFHATNNDAVYEALINGLKLALEMKVENLNMFSDSLIVVYQINGGYQAKGPRTELYLKCAQRIIAKLSERQPSVPEHEVGSLSDGLVPMWMKNILAYIKEGSLPDEKNECERYANYYNNPVAPLTSLMIPWPFAMWGIDLIGELPKAKEGVNMRIAAYQQRTATHYSSKVRARNFKVGDLVLHPVMPNTKVVSHRVFGENWEGPYKIKSVLWEGTYHLNDMQDKLILRVWNAEHLRKYCQQYYSSQT
ncbi:hypothetical protein AgCh_005444 [Apium graveolens]